MVLLLVSMSSHAALVVTAIESGGDVILITDPGGSLNLNGLTFVSSPNLSGGALAPLDGGFALGDSSAVAIDAYTGYTGPTTIGSGALVLASSGTGDRFGIALSNQGVMVPDGYISGSALTGTSTYASASFATLGLTPGVYEWSWTGDSITLNVGVVPVPGAAGLFVSGLSLLGWLRRKTC